jgi:hypothetical protein
MNGTAPSVKSKWYTEPLRRIAAGLAWTVAALGTVIAVANEFTGFGFIPDNIRTDVTIGIGIATGAVAILQKIQGELARNGVPGTNFNGMLSPQTTHNAMVASAQVPPVMTLGGQAVQVTPTVQSVGEALGQDVDGNHVAVPSIPQPPQPTVTQPDLAEPQDGGTGQ